MRQRMAIGSSATTSSDTKAAIEAGEQAAISPPSAPVRVRRDRMQESALMADIRHVVEGVVTPKVNDVLTALGNGLAKAEARSNKLSSTVTNGFADAEARTNSLSSDFALAQAATEARFNDVSTTVSLGLAQAEAKTTELAGIVLASFSDTNARLSALDDRVAMILERLPKPIP